MNKSDHPLYGRWQSMMYRCYKPDCLSYPNYGGRGITVCDRWHDFDSYCADIGTPIDGLEIDRIDNDGDYEPGNIRWATPQQQSNNRRSNVTIAIDGKQKTIAEWARCAGVSYSTLNNRIKNGWDLQKAVTTAPQRRDVTYEGKTQSLLQWSKELGIPHQTLSYRMNEGWPLSSVFSTEKNMRRKPAKRKGRKRYYVSYHNRSNKYQVTLNNDDGTRTHFGSFSTRQEAIDAAEKHVATLDKP